MSSEDASRSNDSRVQALADERDIRAVLHRYARALDKKDWALLATCFVDDVTAEYETIGRLEGYPAIEGVCRTALAPMSVTQHLIGNVDVQVDGDTARSTCYLHAQHVRPNTPGGDSNIIAGMYEDALVRTSDGWRIRHRTLHVWWTFGNPEIHEVAKIKG